MILVLTNADTEILALRSVIEGLPPDFPSVRAGNPAALDAVPDLEGVRIVILRLLGGRRVWDQPFAALSERCRRDGVALLAFGGESEPDAELTAASTVPSATVTEAFRYLVNGGVTNLENLLRFAADSVLLTGFGFAAPEPVPSAGVWDGAGIGRRDRARDRTRPLIGVVFYRAHLLAGNTQFVADLCDAIEARGADALPVYCYSLRPDADDVVEALDLLSEHEPDALVTTVLAMGRTSGASGSESTQRWSVPQLEALDLPVVQAPPATRPYDVWITSDTGLSPVDVAMSVAIPELDGRIIGPAFSFKEQVDDGDELGAPVFAYRTVADRTDRVAGLAVRLARLRRTPASQRRVAIVLSAYPTRRSRLGNAVGLDTPASLVLLLDALAEAGYRVDRSFADGDAVMAELADGLTYDAESLTSAQLARAVGRLDAVAYREWFATLAEDARGELEGAWGQAPGTARLHDGDLVFSGIDLGNVLIAIQPPRGYGDDPVAVYHSPTLPPTHHYLGFYRWLDEGWGADAVVHLGKHGTLEWLPGKAVGLSAGCFPDVALGDVPYFYPFLVSDPGEGTQAKRRTHAVIIDHLLPPMTRADTYDDLARLEQLFDEYADISALDPAKLPVLRERIWEVIRAAELHRDLGLDADGPEADEFDDVLLHVDGYLCELKDAQIRGGLHTLGAVPHGDALVDLVLAITRLDQGPVRSLRAAMADRLDLDLDAALTDRAQLDAIEAGARSLVEAARDREWKPSDTDDPPTVTWISEQLVPDLARTGEEITNLVRGLAGGYVPAGPSGALTRGGAHVLPTGRNFYAVDPRALPSTLAWDVGRGLADALLARHLDEEGVYPETVGLVLWGTAAMRTHGDDVAEVLALLGIRPVWEPESRRVVGVEAIPLAELGRPRVDVTVRISGFFRDAFPNLVDLMVDAGELAASLEEPDHVNFVRAHRSVDPRVFGPAPGGYGSGIFPLLESGDWRGDQDLAAVYLAWGGWSYGRGGSVARDEPAMQRRFAAIEVAVKNQDNREHDIFDSEDYLQDHGGMIATIRALTGADPKAWFGDSSDPSRPRVRALAEEAARVVRSRVLNPKWIGAMQRHGYKGASELAATVDFLFGYDATAHVVADWMYERVTDAYVADPSVRQFFEDVNPWALRGIAERLLEAEARGLWDASPDALSTLRAAVLEAEGWEERR
jgi:cobaltochelatase CobN